MSMDQVPVSWQILPLKRIISMKSGEAITADRIEESGPYPVFGANGQRGYTETWTHDGVKILIGRQGALCGNVNVASGRFFASEHALVVEPSAPVDLGWLAYLLEALDLGQYSTSAAQPGIGVDVVSRVLAPIAPSETQSAIARFLDQETARIDELIAEQQGLVTALEERRRSVIRRLVGNFPRKKLHRHAIVGNGSTPSRENVEYWSAGTVAWVNSGVVNLPQVNEPSELVTETALRECHLPMVEADSLLVGLTGEGKTRGTVTITSIPTTINQHLAFVTPRDGTWLTQYLRYAVAAQYDYLRFISGGSGSTKGALTCGALGALWFPAPDQDVQARVVAEIKRQTGAIDRLVDETTQLIALLKERRAALITAAVTGQIDVRAS